MYLGYNQTLKITQNINDRADSLPLYGRIIIVLGLPHVLEPDDSVPLGRLGQRHHVVHQDLTVLLDRDLSCQGPEMDISQSELWIK